MRIALALSFVQTVGSFAPCVRLPTVSGARVRFSSPNVAIMQEQSRLHTSGRGFQASDQVIQDKMQSAVPDLRIESELQHLAKEASTFPKYDIGMVMEHKKHGYRGVVLAFDRECKAAQDWIDAYSIGSLPRGTAQPFYTVLVDARDRGPSPQVTYVAEDNVRVSQQLEPVLHPVVDRMFEGCARREPAPHYPASVEFDLRYEPGPELETLMQHLEQLRTAGPGSA